MSSNYAFGFRKTDHPTIARAIGPIASPGRNGPPLASLMHMATTNRATAIIHKRWDHLRSISTSTL